MIDEIYEPLDRFANEFKETFSRLTSETFERLRKQSGVDEDANVVLCRKIKKLQAKKEESSSRKSLFTTLIVLVCILCVFLIGFCFVAGSDQTAPSAKTGYKVIGAMLGLGVLLVYLFSYLIPEVRRTGRLVAKLTEIISENEAEAWAQMQPLNSLFDWRVMTGLIESTMPGIRFDPFFPEERLDDFHRSFGWDDSLNEEKSVVQALSGTLYGYPFIFGELKKMEWGKETYSGELRIHWTERERDSKGDYHTVSHSQTLTAHVTEPIPVYSTEKLLIYGNDAAEKLLFSRVPSKYSGLGEGIHTFGEKHELKKLRKYEQILTDESQYTMVGNHEFEVLFHAVDRTDETLFRFLFTSLAQQQMVKILNDRTIGYGDDFSFWKNEKLLFLKADHLEKTSIDTSPQQFSKYDLQEIKNNFQKRCEDFFRCIYFALAPILAIPQYQEKRPIQPDTSSDNKRKNRASFWEWESLANYYGDDRFKHESCITQCILKAQVSERTEEGHAIVDVQAYGYMGAERTTHVSVRGGDGRRHDVPVHWVEYLPVSRDSSFEAVEMEETAPAAPADPSRAEAIRDFFRVHSKDRADSLFRRAILSWIGR